MAGDYADAARTRQRHFAWRAGEFTVKVPRMRMLLVFALLGWWILPVNGAETAETTPAPRLPSVAEAIPSSVKELGKPSMMSFPTGIRMAVTAANEKVQAEVLQGLNHLHGGWEFEASRHFAEAMTEDPECLMAHWGMVMCLLNPGQETAGVKNAAVARMLDLIEKGRGSELERGYAYGLIKYLEEGPAAASIAFRKVAEKFPNDLQAAVFAALFGRGGYDQMGDPTPDQEEAEKILMEQIKKNPQSPIPLNALLVISAEGRDLTNSIEMARGLSKMLPDYPPAFHLLGHYEWRCGHHAAAATAFGRASSFYQRWMADQKVSVADCPEWVRSECYRIVALVSKGEFDTAYAAARQVAATPLPAKRPASPGARILWWEAKTLPARVLLHRGLKGNAEEAFKSLPAAKDTVPIRKESLANWWIDGLRIALEVQRLIDKEELTTAREVLNALAQHGEMMSKTQKDASVTGERSEWTRAFRALEVLASDLHGKLTMAGPAAKRDLAYNWFASATDRQLPATMLNPPMLLSPMASHLGGFFLATKKPEEAIEAYQRALELFPNDMNSLVGLKSAFEAAGKTQDAQSIGKRIEELKAN